MIRSVTATRNESDSTLAVRDTAGGSKNRTKRRAIARAFRDAIRAITLPIEHEQPEARGRRGGETAGGFRRLARKLARRFDPSRSFRQGAAWIAHRQHRTIKLPAEAYAGARAYLADTLDWFNLWQHDQVGGGESTSHFDTNSDHLFPRP